MGTAPFVRTGIAVRAIEWPTVALMIGCYGLWAGGTTLAATLWLPLGMAMTIFATTLHASLTHEALHGHPFRSPKLNALMVFPALSIFIPYLRFRDTHLAHHKDCNLTDPYDDPESNYLDPAVWATLPAPVRMVLRVNNTLAGRIVVGPLVGQIAFLRADWRAFRAGAPGVALAWAVHVPAVALVVAWMVFVASLPLWAWAVSVYAALSILKIRTFLEHRAHDRASGRTVIIEDRGPLALLFLNNNLHVVHHMHANLPWYRLPQVYRANKDRYLARNDGYLYASYAQVFRRYFWRTKDPVAHPLWRPR